MSIDLPSGVEAQLRALAAQQGRQLPEIVEEAIRQYIEASSITDVDAREVAETQEALVRELPPLDDWKAGDS
jgi:predicted transcriptional regulator